MTKAFDIIQGPIITEKTMGLKENFNKYTFKVAKSANKIEIKNAVEEIFKVKVYEFKNEELPEKYKEEKFKDVDKEIEERKKEFVEEKEKNF